MRRRSFLFGILFPAYIALVFLLTGCAPPSSESDTAGKYPEIPAPPSQSDLPPDCIKPCYGLLDTFSIIAYSMSPDSPLPHGGERWTVVWIIGSNSYIAAEKVADYGIQIANMLYEPPAYLTVIDNSANSITTTLDITISTNEPIFTKWD